VLVGELPGGGREQEEGQHEQRLRQVLQDVRRHRRVAGGRVGEQDHQRLLEDVVVERAEELYAEEGREAPFPQKAELVAHVFFFSKKRRVSKTDFAKRRPWNDRWRFSTKSNSSGLCLRISVSTGTADCGIRPSC